MNRRSNMNANIAKTALRTRMKLNGTRTPSISGVTHGPVLRCPTIAPHSTAHPLAPLKQIPAGIAVMNFLGLLQASTVWMLKQP
jgi:hypothetical protein